MKRRLTVFNACERKVIGLPERLLLEDHPHWTMPDDLARSEIIDQEVAAGTAD